MTADGILIEAHEALLDSGGLIYFERRGIQEETVRAAYLGYDPGSGAFLYPCFGKDGRLLGIHYKSEGRDAKGKRRQWWAGYATDLLPPKECGGIPDDPAKVIPFGMETLGELRPGSLVVLCCGEEDALSLRSVGLAALSQPGAGLLEPDYARMLRGVEVTVFYDVREEGKAKKDALTLREAGAAEVRVVAWPPGAPNGADTNDRLVEDPDAFEAWAQRMIAAAQPVSSVVPGPAERAGRPDEYVGGNVARAGGSSGRVGTLLSEVTPECVDWLWDGRIPKGKLTIVEGDPGEGKSALTTDLAARVSAGRPWPDGTPLEAGGVVICSAEDGVADTVRPRLDAAGGDPSKVLDLSTLSDETGERPIIVPDDLDAIGAGIGRVGAKLLILDPLSAFLSGKHDVNKDTDVRRACPAGDAGRKDRGRHRRHSTPYKG